ncbi:Biotin carboxyl carrier protein of acetyl-coa carboxylase protein [Thalictrum thalictroides]|uniref:Biotin carboxyl carrier protein of acetyl-CoA carboxylase n=1 Tax=Thalictrum thalictroides TaxID=46969 RepID=A0A7J6VXY1_THATH|nr:Biotin carboxyl carrier protein of acetyl-coa carboxylase protein [Thalictrum thalictroides]
MASSSSSFTIPYPKSSLLNGSQLQTQQHNKYQPKISFQSKSAISSSSSYSVDQKPRFFKSQGAALVKSTIWKVQAQLSEVAEKTTNSAPVPKDKLEVPASAEEEKPAVQTAVPDASSITAFMTQVSDLVKLVDSRDITELHLKQLDCELIIRKKEALPQPPAVAPVYMMQPPNQHVLPSQPPPAPASPASSAPALPAPAKSNKSSHPPLKCPMAGTFYRCPGPGEPPFVKVGDKVQKGQVVCIVEAMKLMNEIEADQSGTLVEVLLEDGKPVSVDTPLFVIEP